MKTIALIAVISIAYFALSISILHFLRSDINPLKQATGYYAVGHYGFVMTSAFFSLVIASLMIIIGLHKKMAAGRSRLGFILLGMWVMGVLIAICLPLNPEGTPTTTLNLIRRISTPISFLCLTLGVILLSLSLRFDKNWYPVHRVLLTLAWLMGATFIATLVNVLTKSGFLGLLQRISLVAFVLWVLAVAISLLILPHSG